MSKRSGASFSRRLDNARRIHAGGDAVGALRIYSELYLIAPQNPELLHTFGVALAQTGRFAEGERCLLQALELAPRNPDVLFDIGALRDAQGKPNEALAMLLRVVEVAPDRIDAWTGIGMYQRDAMNPTAAAAAYLQAYRLDPNQIQFALNAAELMNPEDGAELIAECLASHPTEEALLLPLAELLMRAERMEEAEPILQLLKVRRPTAGMLSRHLGAVYLRLKRFPDAAAVLYEAISDDPSDAESWILLSNIRDAIGDGDGAVAAIERAVSLRPNDLNLLGVRARLQQHTMRVETAMEDLANLPSAARATSNARLIRGMLLPPILDSEEQIEPLRNRWMETMLDVVARPTFVPEPWESVGLTDYFLGYQGREDRPLVEAWNRATLASSPQLQYTARNLSGGGGGKKIKVGFLSAYLRNHSVGRVLIRLMANLDRERFEVILLQLPDNKGHGQELGEAAADRTVKLIAQLDASRAAIEAENLDVLIYSDFHMSTFGDALSHSRLAPVQATTWGHPGTSGRSTIDYWISYKDWEPEGNERLYTESLVRLNVPPYVSAAPPKVEKPRNRDSYGLRSDARLYGCLQSLFKFHPAFDEFLAGILEADPKARLVLPSGEHFRWRDRLQKRFSKSLDVGRIDFLPKLSFSQYLNVLNLCEVHLDPIHFGGANTSFDALSLGKPIVTLPGDQMRGRVTLGAYRQMGYEDLVVDSKDQYIEVATRLAQDRRFNREAQRAILDSQDILFDNLAAVREFEGWVERVVREPEN